MKILDTTVFNRKLFLVLYVMELLMHGVIYHFVPQALDIVEIALLVWPVLILAGDIINRRVFSSVYQWILWLFLAVIIASFWNQYHGFTLSFVRSLIKHMGFFYVLFSASGFYETDDYELTMQRLAFFAVLFVFVFAFASAVCYWTYKAGITLPMGLNAESRIFTYGHYGNENRFCGLFGYSTNGGNLCVLAIILCWYLYESTIFNAWLAGIPTAVFVYMIDLLDYRAGMVILAFIALVLFYRLLRRKWSVFGSVLIVIAVGLLGCAAFIYLKQDYFARFMDLMRTDPFDAFRQISTGRTEYWYMVINKLPSHFWLGWGWLNSDALEFYFDAHNLLINLLMWTGVIGCGLFTVFLVMMAVRLILNRKLIKQRRSTWLVMLVVCVFLESMLERAIAGTTESPETAFFWISAGYLVYLNRTLKGARDVQ